MKHFIDWLCVLTFIIISGSPVANSAPDATEMINPHQSELKLATKYRELSEQRGKESRGWLGGSPADWSMFPYTVFVEVNDPPSPSGGGVIIGEQHVLTSQHITFQQVPQNIKVIIGEVEKNVASISTTSGYSAAGLSILKLESKFDLSGPNITSIPLQGKEIPLGTDCVLSGIKSLETPTPPESYVHYVNIPIIENVVCNILWTEELSDQALCGGAYNAQAESLFPNSGDPLVCDGVLTGITSLLSIANDPDRPGFYGKVSHYKKWIEDEMTGSNSHRLNHNILAVILIAPVSFWISKFHV